MTRQPNWLLDRRRDVFSQFGEDGVIEAVLDLVPDPDRWCVEFGAWDGKYLSNTRNLIEGRDYRAVLIEADRASFKTLKANCAGHPGLHPIRAMVGFSAADGLDHILSQTPCPRDFDFLSIDVDGVDIHIWRAVVDYRPKLVCVEFNPTIPTEVVFEQAADPRVTQGASLAALVGVGREKGYELVCANDCNAFFVRGDLFPLMGIEDNSPERLRLQDAPKVMVFSGYDGALVLSAPLVLPWHGERYSTTQVQVLPRFLRKYPLNYTILERWGQSLYRRLSGRGRRAS